LIQKVWYKRLSRVGDIMEDADVAVAANFAFKSYGADKGIQT
jgi:hypothetical protein